MPRVLNLSALVADIVTVNIVQPDGTTQSYDLKDDISLDAAALVMQLDDHFKAATTNFERLQITENETTHVVGEIFRHTYPEVTDEMVRVIKPSDRMAIIQLFFTSLIDRYSAQASSTTSSTEPTSQETAEQTESQEQSTASASLPVETQSPSN